jgi:hypothetical protein
MFNSVLTTDRGCDRLHLAQYRDFVHFIVVIVIITDKTAL